MDSDFTSNITFRQDIIPEIQNATSTVCAALFGVVAGTYPCWERIGIIMAGGVAGAIIFPLLVPIVLCLLGFTCWGVMAGSAAACCQSSIGDVGAGSCFAGCQSAGAGGCSGCYLILLIPTALAGAVLGGYIAYIQTF